MTLWVTMAVLEPSLTEMLVLGAYGSNRARGNGKVRFCIFACLKLRIPLAVPRSRILGRIDAKIRSFPLPE